MTAELGQRLVASFVPGTAAMVVDGDRVYPTYNHSVIPELIELLPSLQPSGLRYIFRMVLGGAAGAEYSNGSAKSLLISLPVSFLGHVGPWVMMGLGSYGQ
jgi:hypothetical protein